MALRIHRHGVHQAVPQRLAHHPLAAPRGAGFVACPGHLASTEVQATVKAFPAQGLEALQDAFLQQRLLQFRYRDAQGDATLRTVEPQCLLLNVPVWYLLAWDTQRQAPRTFRLDRMSQLHMQPERFALRAAGSLMQDIGAFFAAL